MVQTYVRTNQTGIDLGEVDFRPNQSKKQRLNELPENEECPVDELLGGQAPLPPNAGHKRKRENTQCSCPYETRTIVERHALGSKEGKQGQSKEKGEPVSDNSTFFLQ